MPLSLVQTASYYAAFVALGITTASLGPTLLGLANQTGSALGGIGFLFATRSLGYLIGAFVGGWLLDRLPQHRFMALVICMLSALLVAVPSIPVLWMLSLALFLVGLMEGGVDVGGNTLIVWVHRDKVAPYMNGLHFFFAIGAFIAPILVGQAISALGGFEWSYWILGAALIPLALAFVPLEAPSSIVQLEDHAAVRPDPLFLGLLVVFFAFFSGTESCLGGWIYTFAVKSSLASETAAAYVNAAFWGSFMCARLLSIPVAARFTPRQILRADFFLALSGTCLLFFAPTAPGLLWIAIVLCGLGTASMFPTLVTLAGSRMVITGGVTSWFFAGASTGCMLFPWLVGQFFERAGPISLPAVTGALLVVALVLFVLVLDRRHL